MHHFMDTAWALLFFLAFSITNQPDCHVFEERHARRVLSLHVFWIGVLGNDIAVVDTGSEEVEEDSSPTLLRPMMEHIIPHHLIHQVDSFHVLLVGLEHGRHRNSFSLSTCTDVDMLAVFNHTLCRQHAAKLSFVTLSGLRLIVVKNTRNLLARMPKAFSTTRRDRERR